MKSKLKIDIEYLIFAWQDDSPQTSYYLNTDTGSVILVQRDLDNLGKLRGEIESGAEHHLYLPKPDRDQVYLDLSDFVLAVSDAKLKAMLEVAMESRDKLGSCKSLLSRYPADLERWQQWQRRAALERVKKWLAAHDLELDDEN